VTASPSAKIIEEQNAAETKLSVTLAAAEWANMLRRFRGGPHSVRLFWMRVASIEGQLTTKERKVTAELEEVLAQQAREELTTRREKVTTQSSVIIKLTNPAENTQLHISFEEKAAVGQRPISPFPPPYPYAVGQRPISPFPPPYPYAQSMAVAVPPAAVAVPPAPVPVSPAAVPVPPAPFNPPQAAR
jgi:hypothetical protein